MISSKAGDDKPRVLHSATVDSATVDPWQVPRLQFASRTRPLVAGAIALAVGIYLGNRWFAVGNSFPLLAGPWVGWTAFAIICSVLFKISHQASRRDQAALRLQLAFALGLLLSSTHVQAPPPSLSAGPMTISGTVINSPRFARESLNSATNSRHRPLRFELGQLRQQERILSGKLRLTGPVATTLARGDRIEVTLWWQPGQQSQWFKHPRHCKILRESSHIFAFFDRQRQRSCRDWRLRFGDRPSAWLCALVLGERAFLSRDTIQRYRDIGLAHLLAISGLHVGLLFGVFQFAIARLRLFDSSAMRLFAITIAGGLMLNYALLAGADTPVLRAVLLGILMVGGQWRMRRAMSDNSLAACFIFLACMQPEQSYRLGFVLSFAAVTGILVFGPRRDALSRIKAPGRGRVIAQSLRVSWGAWLGAGIVLVHLTPENSPWSPLTTLLFLPLVVTSLLTGILALLPQFPGLEYFLQLAAAIGDYGYENLARLLDLLPWTPMLWPAIPAISISLILASTGLWLWVPESRCWPQLLLLLSIFPALLPKPGAELRAIHAGRGQSILLNTPEIALSYDAGSMEAPHRTAMKIIETLRKQGRNHLPLLIISHAHLDHFSAVPYLLDRIVIQRCWVPLGFDKLPGGQMILQSLARHHVEVLFVGKGYRESFGPFELIVHHPPMQYPKFLQWNANDASLVLQIQGEGLDVLLTGDLENSGLAQVESLQPQLLIAPHHGRNCTYLSYWLERIQPQWILASSELALGHKSYQKWTKTGRLQTTSARNPIVWKQQNKNQWTSERD